MRRADETPYDGPCCERCGRDVEADGLLCDDCLELAQERLERRRAAREMAAREVAA